MKLFLFGAGYSATHFAQTYHKQFQSITGTTRKADNFAALEAKGIDPVLFDDDFSPVSTELIEKLRNATHLIISVSPGLGFEKIIKILAEDILPFQNSLQWVTYLSTTGVYGDKQGAWVTEDTATAPISTHSVQRVNAENSLQLLCDTYQLSLSILRLSGIYGPGRNPFVSLRNATAKRIIKPDQVFNRIHVDDIAGAIMHLAKSDNSGIYNISDNFPAPNQDVITYAAELMGIEPPEEVQFSDANMSPMAQAFYSENKRISNTKLLNSGFKLAYPDYKIGLKTMWDSHSWT